MTATHVYLFRSFHLLGDSRAQKMIADYESRGFKITKIVWTRGVDKPVSADTIVYNAKGLISGRFRNFFYFLSWHFFIVRLLIAHRKRVSIIHCIDLDTGLACAPMARLLGKVLVYDGFDHFASSRDLTGIAYRIGHILERSLCRFADLCILPDSARIAQYGFPDAMAAKICIIANMPSPVEARAIEHSAVSAPIEHLTDVPLHFCYVGTLEQKHRALEYIPWLCAQFGDHLRFTVAGNGELENFFQQEAAKLNNLAFLGYVSYEQGLRCMQASDAIYGAYLLSSRNHHYAAPNKMFEHLFLGKPLVTSRATPVAAFVAQYGTGYIFDGTYPDLVSLVSRITRVGCDNIGLLARRLWRSTFSAVRERQVSSFFDKLVATARRHDQN